MKIGKREVLMSQSSINSHSTFFNIVFLCLYSPSTSSPSATGANVPVTSGGIGLGVWSSTTSSLAAFSNASCRAINSASSFRFCSLISSSSASCLSFSRAFFSSSSYKHNTPRKKKTIFHRSLSTGPKKLGTRISSLPVNLKYHHIVVRIPYLQPKQWQTSLYKHMSPKHFLILLKLKSIFHTTFK